MISKLRSPFGEADCESELISLGDRDYSELYFDETPFNDAALRPETYLIIGRRGSGKTALSQYFSFQTTIPDPIYIDVDEPRVYSEVLSNIATRASEVREIAIPRLKRVWEYIIWRLIFENTRNETNAISNLDRTPSQSGRPSHQIKSIFDHLLEILHEDEAQAVENSVEALLSDEQLLAAKTDVLVISEKRSVIMAMDTLEKYDVSDSGLMNAMAALVQFAADFNLEFSNRGIHLKLFMAGEVFPYLKAEVLQNPLKSIKNPVYLFWRPKDLLRLISWRFFHYLRKHDQLRGENGETIDWKNHRDVRAKMWDPYFGREVTNARGFREDTLSYVLRHTQKRPRQVILLCNSIASRAKTGSRFPIFSEEDIKFGVKQLETELAVEIVNSFSSLYPHVSQIVNGLMNMPMIFKGNELDRRAHETASHWPREAYSPASFRHLVTELGIVGRVLRKENGHIAAVFEYSLKDGLELTHRDECVVHPMFYSRFNIHFNSDYRVLPVSTDVEGHREDESFYD
jgi:hypothetical protein